MGGNFRRGGVERVDQLHPEAYRWQKTSKGWDPGAQMGMLRGRSPGRVGRALTWRVWRKLTRFGFSFWFSEDPLGLGESDWLIYIGESGQCTRGQRRDQFPQ